MVLLGIGVACAPVGTPEERLTASPQWVGAAAAPYLSRGFIVIDLDALGDECCEPLGLGFGQVEMIPHAVLAAEESDREPVIAGSEGDIALNKGALGMGSGELCHNA